jgi:hypothetical protein
MPNAIDAATGLRALTIGECGMIPVGIGHGWLGRICVAPCSVFCHADLDFGKMIEAAPF